MSQWRWMGVDVLHPGSLPIRRGRIGIVLIVLLFVGAAGLGLGVASQHHGHGPSAVTFSVTVTGNHMSPPQMSVHDGDQVVLSITGDRNETLLLQGYQQRFKLAAGIVVVGSFVAAKVGTYDFVIDGSNAVLGRLEVAA